MEAAAATVAISPSPLSDAFETGDEEEDLGGMTETQLVGSGRQVTPFTSRWSSAQKPAANTRKHKKEKSNLGKCVRDEITSRLVWRDDDVGGDEEGAVLGRGDHIVCHVPHPGVDS